jgi:flagellum-specific peptidoglycan hydrolase FlgJ
MTHPTRDIIDAARAAQAKWKVPASVSLAQWALESGWGHHMPPDSLNPFGIKARPGQPSVTVPTREQDKYGHVYTINAAFRKFDTMAQAFDEHARLLATAPVYANAIAALPSVTDFIHAMAPHYATDVQYEHLLNSIIRGSNLTQYDLS